MNWYTDTTVNTWTGQTRTRHLRKFTAADDTARVYAEVYVLAGRVYWSANIHIPNRPDLSRIAYGTYAATPRGISVAKARASRLALATLRKTDQFTRAA